MNFAIRPLVHSVALAMACLYAVEAGAATFLVNSTEDAGDNLLGDGDCKTGEVILISAVPLTFGPECTLRAAIEQANASAGPDIIRFSSILPTSAGKVEFSPMSAYPPITDGLLIDGYSAFGYDVPDPDADPVVNIGGTFISTSNARGLVVASGADNTTLQGLAVYQFPSSSITVNGASNVTIEGSQIGLNRGVFVRGSGSDGISLSGPGPIVVGKTCDASACTGKRNVIVGSTWSGIYSSADNVSIAGNLLGTSPSGESLSIPFGGSTGNQFSGIEVGNSLNVQIGSEVEGGGNLASGNLISGIEVRFGDGIVVVGNKVGTNLAGTDPLGNEGDGIRVQDADNCEIRSNLVGGNNGNGIQVEGAGHRVVGNFVGTNEFGANLGNAATTGILVAEFERCAGCQIGDVGEGNVVGFHLNGIKTGLTGINSDPVIEIKSNYVGTNSLGQDLGNAVGINLDDFAEVGSPNGLDNGLGNVIGFNTRTGILVGEFANILGNYVGTNAAEEDLGNKGYGIEIEGFSLIGAGIGEAASEVTSHANRIAFNDDSAIFTDYNFYQSAFSSRGNMIYGNGGDVPIDIVAFGDVAGPTPNDAGDADDRAQNYPVFDISQTGIDPGTGNFEVRYLVDTLPENATYPLDIDFYLAPGPDSQADIWIGSDRYPESSATAYRTVSIPAPQGIPLVGRVVATATSGGYFNSTSIQTSELSTQLVVVLPEPGFGMLLAVGVSVLGYLSKGRRTMHA